MGTDPLAFLRAAHAGAQRDAENARGQWVDVGLPFSAVAHAERHSPDAVLGRIAAERKLIAACEEIFAVDGWEYYDAPDLAEKTITALAEAWGWTEETT